MGNRNISGRLIPTRLTSRENFFHQHEPEHTCWESAWESLRVVPLPLSQVKRVSDSCCMWVLERILFSRPGSSLSEHHRPGKKTCSSAEVAQRGGRAVSRRERWLGGSAQTEAPSRPPSQGLISSPHGPPGAEGLSSCLEEGLDKQESRRWVWRDESLTQDFVWNGKIY